MSTTGSRQGSASKSRLLRSGYTTGACAAAAAKAAAIILLEGQEAIGDRQEVVHVGSVEIPFPDGSRHSFRVQGSGFRVQDNVAWASVIKDAGDDPDVTNGAEIIAEVRSKKLEVGADNSENNTSVFSLLSSHLISIKGGPGVGRITKPGLSIPVGEPAINPVPREMIRTAVKEAVKEAVNSRQSTVVSQGETKGDCTRFMGEAVESGLSPSIEITISVTDGEELAKRTLNSRLGIIGGISILGTTGIVRPLSAEAWTASIKSAMDVAKAVGCDEVVLSSGRTSEKAHMKKFGLPEESYVMMGDYLEFSFKEAATHGFKRIHLCAQWAKMLKIAMGTPQTHVRHGVIELRKSVELLKGLGIQMPDGREFNTAREIYEYLASSYPDSYLTFLEKVCSRAKETTGQLTKGVPVTGHLVSYGGLIIADSE
ncbi:MAG: cobalt-precorrin-5B (C(1))-methyltransferase [Nitrospirae bacterium]|nr:MAG: cobalt-precorrin-5B (C(1))-methyltransferase [Nitrospirota bacterium]